MLRTAGIGPGIHLGVTMPRENRKARRGKPRQGHEAEANLLKYSDKNRAGR